MLDHNGQSVTTHSKQVGKKNVHPQNMFKSLTTPKSPNYKTTFDAMQSDQMKIFKNTQKLLKMSKMS